jgi:ATP-binding cassette subfamily B protein
LVLQPASRRAARHTSTNALKRFFAIADAWELSPLQQCRLLKIPSPQVLERYRLGQAPRLSATQQERAALIANIQYSLTTEPGVKDDGLGLKAQGLGKIQGAIEIRDLTFAFGDREVLSHVSFSVNAGETVAIVGGTGSGKSTLVNLLPRLHNPPRGSMLIDGRDVLDIPLAELRAAIGFVPQEPFLFSDTLAANVALGAPDMATRQLERIRAAGTIAQLDQDVADFPKGYDTMVGERGITLSGGQKQRTALARAVMIDPQILILDDALSAVDTYTEEEILERLRGVMLQRTSIIVSHRVSTVRSADQILVLEDGAIVERGTHDQLVRRDGLYAELHDLQFSTGEGVETLT